MLINLIESAALSDCLVQKVSFRQSRLKVFLRARDRTGADNFPNVVCFAPLPTPSLVGGGSNAGEGVEASSGGLADGGARVDRTKLKILEIVF